MKSLSARLLGRAASLSVLLAAALVGPLACQQSPDDLREWKPEDHDHTDQPNADQVQVSDAGTSPMAALGIDEVALVTWRQNCTTCHGLVGRGDGPQGAMLKPPDLTDPAWQAAATDEAITTAIKNGRGRMPAFNLPDNTVKTLVRLIRLLNRDRLLDGGMGSPEAGAVDAGTNAMGADAAGEDPGGPGTAPAPAPSGTAPAPAGPGAAPATTSRPAGAPPKPAQPGTPATATPTAGPRGAPTAP